MAVLSEAKIPHPEDWDLSVPELAMLLADKKHGPTRLSFVMNRFFVTNETASYWLSLVRDWERERQAS